MGAYINLGNDDFQSIRRGEYVDKSGLIAVVNNTLNTELRYSFITRCRRFGKSMAAKMLCAYYDKTCDSRSLFADLEIANDPSFEEHLNKYPVIYLDVTNFTTREESMLEIVGLMQQRVKEELLAIYHGVTANADDDLMDVLIKVVEHYHEKFIMIIDEWDAICREASGNKEAMDRYVKLLRRLFKGSNSGQVFAGVYLTGILPIKKYKTESALNNFQEYSMVKPGKLARFFGFTKEEVEYLAKEHGMNVDELVKWYDGYQVGLQPSMFNPNSVLQAINQGNCESFWSSTGAYDAVATYIQKNFGGLKDDIIKMLAGGRCPVNPTKFQNDMSIIRSKDDVLTVLIHLGYLSYDWRVSECYIPNREVAGEIVNAVEDTNWSNVIRALQQSAQLLNDTLDGDEEAVARGVEAVHDENTSILSYNNENSLACVVSLAYYYAKNDYIVHREYPSGKGFADLVMIPRKGVDSPAIVVELKCSALANRSKLRKVAESAIDQIRRKEYPVKVAEYADNLLLVAISYDKEQKKHYCKIEEA